MLRASPRRGLIDSKLLIDYYRRSSPSAHVETGHFYDICIIYFLAGIPLAAFAAVCREFSSIKYAFATILPPPKPRRFPFPSLPHSPKKSAGPLPPFAESARQFSLNTF